MLTIKIPDSEIFNEDTSEFIRVKGTTLQLEHSLVSISKWESKWCKPFLGSSTKTNEEMLDYIRCMSINSNAPDELFYSLGKNELDMISDYISAEMTATTFRKDQVTRGSREIVTSELIYYWMISMNIPFECQKWHLNRLLTLIRVCSIKNTPPKQLGKQALLARNRELNAARRSQLNTRG